MEGEDIYAVQLELTLEGDYAGCTFSPDSDTAYAPDCGVETARNRTYVTIYLTDRAPINDGESLSGVSVRHSSARMRLGSTPSMPQVTCPLAAARPTLYCQVRLDDEEIRLTLEDLEGEDIYAVQLEWRIVTIMARSIAA